MTFPLCHRAGAEPESPAGAVGGLRVQARRRAVAALACSSSWIFSFVFFALWPCLAAPLFAAAEATTVVLDFEGVGDLQPVGDFYGPGGAGGPARDYGVVFGANAIGAVDSDDGGIFDMANEPSGTTALYFFAGTGRDQSFLSAPGAGFTSLSFRYICDVALNVTAYDGPDMTGAVLAEAVLPAVGTCDPSLCGDPNGYYGVWGNVTLVPFSGVARSARFATENAWLLVDNMVLTLVAPPTKPPTRQPTNPPTKPPTKPPTTPPTKPPTAPPTKSPVAACPGGATYWIYNPSTNLPIRELVNNSATCLPRRYNIEVRPCGDGGGSPPPALPVTIKLLSSSLAVLRTQREYFAPFFLWGDNTSTGDVFPSKTPLRNGGVYHLSSSAAVGRVRFTQACP